VDYDVISVTTQWLVGRIFKVNTPQGDRWQWAITGDTVVPRVPSLGFADTLDDAKRDFAATWRRWLAMTGRDEATHRSFYGRPVDLEPPIPGCPEPG
jgi:hypothetical protein